MKGSLSILLVCAAFILCGTEFALTKNGKAVSSIVLRKNATPVEQHAASELANFLAKISAGERPAVGTAPVKGKYPIYLELTEDKRVKEEGLKLSADEKALRIAGNTPVGVLYGVYEVLKRYGGILWLVPGEKGEYFKVKPTITVPEMTYIHNPDFSYRDVSKVCMSNTSPVWDTWDWGLRNNMRFHASPHMLRKYFDQLKKRAFIAKMGGHCFSPLLVYNPKNKNMKEIKKYAEGMLKEHPEYFPLIRGKRVLSYHGGVQSQPCTSNPEVIKLIAKNAAYQMKNSIVQPVILGFCNNDIPSWCECENCVAQDPPEERKNGIVSTRYWLFANAVFEEINKLFPEARFGGHSYQTFSRAPKGVKPYQEKNLSYVSLSNHRHCWKHPLNDKNCPTNRWYYEYNKEWNDMGVPLKTYEEFLYAGRQFIPAEKNFVDELKFFKKHFPNVTGMETEICCPDGIYNGRFKNYLNYNNWEMMWQTIYLAMRFHWDVNADYDKEYEKINSLYYGKGWDGGMREFRKLLTELYMNASGCHGYGHSTPRGKFLDVPGAKEKLYKYLDSAEKAAGKDPDPRASANVKKVREFFEMTWIKEYNNYITSFRSITAYPFMDKITIDGKLDEKDWRNADVTTRFKTTRTNEVAKYQTAVKVAYDADNIYLGIECLEDLKEDKLFVLDNKHDGPVWNDNGVEIFINDPILGSAYYQFIINSKGVVTDGIANPRFDKAYESGAEVKTRFVEGKYIMEVKIPAKSITGSKITAGTVLRMNVMRCRRPVSGAGEKESSTWGSGQPYSVETYHPVSFAAPRQVSAGNRTIVDTRAWKNGSFDEVKKNPRVPKHWNLHGSKIAPASWAYSNNKGYGGDLEYLLHPGSKTNYFVRLRSGFIISNYTLKKGEYTVVYRARGKGTLQFRVLANNTTVTLHNEKIDTGNWKTFRFTFTPPANKNSKKTYQGLVLWPQGKDKSYIDVDDIYLR